MCRKAGRLRRVGSNMFIMDTAGHGQENDMGVRVVNVNVSRTED